MPWQIDGLSELSKALNPNFARLLRADLHRSFIERAARDARVDMNAAVVPLGVDVVAHVSGLRVLPELRVVISLRGSLSDLSGRLSVAIWLGLPVTQAIAPGAIVQSAFFAFCLRTVCFTSDVSTSV